jgi:hypothetical protein
MVLGTLVVIQSRGKTKIIFKEIKETKETQVKIKKIMINMWKNQVTHIKKGKKSHELNFFGCFRFQTHSTTKPPLITSHFPCGFLFCKRNVYYTAENKKDEKSSEIKSKEKSQGPKREKA